MDTKLADDLIGQRAGRIEKLNKLKSLGINPFPSTAKKDHTNAYVIEHFDELEGKSTVLAGRLMSMREHGKLAFADLVDSTGKIQIFLKQDSLKKTVDEGYLGWKELGLLDVGDFVEVGGTVIRTTRGEISLEANYVRLLTKSIRPMPNTLKEKEAQFRRRYLDLVLNPERRALFVRKAKFWEVSRKFMQQHGFIEVETPVLEHVTGGADARPFVTHHNDLNEDFYMRISTELYQKRLVGGGFEKVFTLAPNFRNEGTSEEHLQEYYQLEWYWAYVSYRENMLFVRDIIRYTAQEVYGKTKFESHGHTFDLADDWKEIDYGQCIKDKFGIDIFTSSDQEMLEILKREKVVLTGAINRNRLIDNLWKLIRKTISGPAFLVNEPKFMSPLAKSKPDQPVLTERFHVIIAGSELGNGYSELNDPLDQLERFLEQQKQRDEGDDEAQMLDIDYVEMLEFGMPPTSGYAHSERLFWFLENVTAREATLFPLMKWEVDELTKKIYPAIQFKVSE